MHDSSESKPGSAAVDPAPSDPRRSATAVQRGFRYQTLLALEAWLALEPGQLLVVEGDEDHDVIGVDPASGQRVRTGAQVKSHAGTLGLRSRPVRDSLRGFLATFVARRQTDVAARFVFVTTADRASYAASDPARAMLDRWERLGDDPAARSSIAVFVRELLADDGDTSATSLDDDAWSDFVGSVRWQFAAPEVSALWDRVLARVGERFPDVSGGLVELLAARLLADLWQASGEDEPGARCRTVADLERLHRDVESASFRAWARDPDGAVRVQALLQEARALDDLLVSGRAVRPKSPQSVGQILGAAYTVVPWSDVGRGEILERLLAWSDTRSAHPADDVRLVTGAGGTGKTRLAIELVQRLRHRGVRAGFLVERRAGRQIDLGALLRTDAPRVVVVDYAETKPELVQELLERVLEPDATKRAPLKVLLIARGVGPWWERLRSSSDKLGALGDEVVLAQLGAMSDDADARGRLFWEAAQVFREREQVTFGAAPDLSDPVFDRVLFIHMAALAMVNGMSVAGRDAILDATLAHERRFWERARADCGDLDANRRRALESVTEKAVAALALIGGASRDEAMCYVERAIDHDQLVRRGAAVLDVLLDLLARQYGGGAAGDTISAPAPDLLAEHLVARTLRAEADGGGRWLHGVFPDADDPRVVAAFVLLGRAASEPGTDDAGACEGGLRALVEVAPEQRAVAATLAAVAVSFRTAHSPLGSILARALRGCTSIDLASQLEKLIPQSTVALRELKVWVGETLRHGTDGAADEARVTHLANVAVAYSQAGRREDAVAAAQEALDLHRRLAKARPDAFEPDLATSLNNLGAMLSDLGRREDALAAAQEALTIRRRLANARPDAFEPELAASLNNLGNMLSDLGGYEDALAAAQEALDVYRRLAKARPDAFEPYVATSLNNLGAMLRDLGRREEALAAAQEALTIRRRLANARPDAFEPDLAMSLNNLGTMLSDLGRREDALAAAQEALTIRR
ncbi:tetratricopeptide repeat protein, partial [Candidatus Binatia bacterium]|nr:tetratricopeptide repeat protein [Candidatus Binatia bacterium]